MPRRFIKRYIPDQKKLTEHNTLKIFGNLLGDPNLWHLNKKSVSGALSLGLFCAFIPLPFQMLIAAAGAIMFRVNLPISVALVWLTNPITIPPMFYFCYLVGAWVLDVPPATVEFALSWEWAKTELLEIWKPLLLGCFMVGTSSAVAGNILGRLVWRIVVVRSWRKRNRGRAKSQRRENEI